MEPQHEFDKCLGGAGGWEMWECVRCRRTAIPNVFGSFWPVLARYLPFCGRWRCRP